jgi:hypothetical protein
MIINMKLEKSIFDDLPQSEKDPEELAIFVLKSTRGDKIKNLKYSNQEINIAARKLVLNGYLRGTVMDFDKCVWSRLTKKGKLWLDIHDRNSSS